MVNSIDMDWASDSPRLVQAYYSKLPIIGQVTVSLPVSFFVKGEGSITYFAELNEVMFLKLYNILSGII